MQSLNGRHGSAASAASDDTVKPARHVSHGSASSLRTMPEERLNISQLCHDTAPGSKRLSANEAQASRYNIAPWELSPGFQQGNGSNQTWPTGGAVPANLFSERYRDDVRRDATHSPRLEPIRAPSSDNYFSGEDRRPSVASATTVSSTGSSQSRTRNYVHKKLHDFFGEDPATIESAKASESNLNLAANPRHKTPSITSAQMSPNGSRPRTPPGSTPEVTPWEFQSSDDLQPYGGAHSRSDAASVDGRQNGERRPSTGSKPSVSSNSSRLHLGRHSRQKSADEGKPRRFKDDNNSDRKHSSKSEGRTSTRRHPNGSTTSLEPSDPKQTRRAQSPASSASRDASATRANNDMSGGSHKRSLFDRLRHRHHKHERDAVPPVADQTSSSAAASSTSLQPKASVRNLVSNLSENALVNATTNTIPDGGMLIPTVTNSSTAPSTKNHTRLPFKSKRGQSSSDPAPIKEAPSARSIPGANESLWDLDTDLTQMEGILATSKTTISPVATPSNASLHTGPSSKGPPATSPQAQGIGSWDAPDSWAVKRVGDENISRLHEIDDNGTPHTEEEKGKLYCIRVFRPDDTFATLALPLNSTVTEIIELLKKKSFMTEELDNYHIILKKNDTSRQLDPGERPIALQRKLLEQAGYNDSDKLEDLGSQDHSYLCRFSFLPVQMSGFSRFEKDPGLNRMQKFSNVDLQGRNLINIPVALYVKSSEIVVLNISRNLSLDVPKDFIQGCTNLREIKYTGNEAWHLPPSFSLATKLTVLDLSNNRLEQLEHAGLDKLHNLASLKLANNKLSSLPVHLSSFKSLRSLNLSSNSFNELPSCVCELSTLVDLDISFNAIVKLPQMTKLRNLERFLMTNNKLSGPMDESIAQLRNLKEIDMRFNKIDNIAVLAKLPHLEHLIASHNSITSFIGSFSKLRTLYLDNNPVTRFKLEAPMPTLTTLNLASGKMAHLPDEVYRHATSITKLILDRNHFVSLPECIGNLQKLEHFSIAKNSLSSLPPEIGRLSELRFMDVRENNINKLPSQVWLCRKLDTLNLSSNVLDGFPKPPTHIPTQIVDESLSLSDNGAANGEEADQLGPMQRRKTSQSTTSYAAGSSSSGTSSPRKTSTSSQLNQGTRKPSTLARSATDQFRKDSSIQTRTNMTFAGSLRHLFLADNRISDDIFEPLSFLQELRILNLSYNELYDVPPRTLRKWQYLSELYLSGNDLSSLPAEELEDIGALKVLHINNNKFQVLPAELGRVQKLAVLDASSNNLKYNVSNWPYDWNWNRNPHLKYLNLSGNKRLEIKPSNSYLTGRDSYNLTDFSALTKLRSLGLLDVTLMIQSVPDTTEDRRVRTMGSSIGTMGYGIADCLGRNEHLSTIDIVVPQFEGHDDETLFGLFDGVPMSNGGSKIAKYLQENFKDQFKDELKKRLEDESPEDALRRTYLALNRGLAILTAESNDPKKSNILPPSVHRNSIGGPTLHEDDLNSGCVATVMYLHGMELYVSNVGDAQAVLIKSEGGHQFITTKHDPASSMERQRIRDAGGFVSRQGKLNDVLEVSRAFGYTQLMPVVIAAPHTAHITITESDEIILLASREMWDFLTPEFAVDLARSERQDLMRASQKLRDIAIAFGASGKMTVMLVGVSDLLRKKERARYRTHSMSLGPSGLPDDYLAPKGRKRGRDATLDSKLARLDQEVEAPVGNVTLVFTDIKNSTLLWETYPIAMRSAIKMHNEIMRRHLRLIGGYEVKTEGDAFMVAFPTVTSALLWAFTIQSQLLEVQWPQEIINGPNGQEVTDVEGNVLFRGLSVRMGIHWGSPVCETDPVTRRMDYFGPMVNRAARIQSVADGGQITVSSDFIAEVQRLLETHMETDRSDSAESEDAFSEDEKLSVAIQRELRSVTSHGFEVQDLGERRLKGLENPEYIYLMYPRSLAPRHAILTQQAEAAKTSAQPGVKTQDSKLLIDLDSVWNLWSVSLRLEMLCSTLESPGSLQLKAHDTFLLERTRERGGEITDRFVMNFVEHQVSRIETCITSLTLRNMVRPFSKGMLEQACSMTEIFSELTGQLQELKALKQHYGQSGSVKEMTDFHQRIGEDEDEEDTEVEDTRPRRSRRVEPEVYQDEDDEGGEEEIGDDGDGDDDDDDDDDDEVEEEEEEDNDEEEDDDDEEDAA